MKKKDKQLVGMIGAVIGTLVFIAVFGVEILDFSNCDWLLVKNPDLVQHYMGWVSYRDSAWHFPIGLIDNIAYPWKVSVIYTDSIPLFALFFKILSPVLPETFQYMGLFGLICFALQGCFGALIVYRCTGKKLYSALSAVFFSASYIMLMRIYIHTALAAHWIILACIYNWYAKQQNASVWESAVSWSGLSVFALTTEAYFMPMVWGIMLCALLNDLLRKKQIKTCIATVLAAGISTIFVGYVMGVFYGSVPASNSGLGIYSFNLNGFFNSLGNSKVFPGLPCGAGQYEGFAYLGAGVFFLIIVFALMVFERFIGKRNKYGFSYADVIPHVFYVVCFTLFAMSPVLTLGNHILTLPVPGIIHNLWSVFRSSGRMIWPVYYLIIIVVLVMIGKYAEKKMALFFLIIGIIFQLYDESHFILSRKNEIASKVKYESSLVSDAWEEIAGEYDHIMIYPNTFKMYSNYKGEELWIFADKNNMSMSIVYLARDISKQKDAEALEHFEQLGSGVSFSDTMYVFIDQLPDQKYGLHYYYVDDLIIAVPRTLMCGVNEITLEEARKLKPES